MVERYLVGRRYTRRERVGADCSDLDGMRAVMNAIASAQTVQRRLADLERRATAHLERAKMPLDPKGKIYGDAAWLRDNERKSLDWYAFNIVNTIRLLRVQIERGEVWNAVDFALELGGLAAEAEKIQYHTAITRRGGRGFRASDKLKDAATRHAEWRALADEHWRRNPSWGAAAIAKEIDPKRARTVRRIIRDRKPIPK
jgi:hypothetical protein